MEPHPVQLTVGEDDLRRSRLTVFFRLLLALPHLILLGLLGLFGILLAPFYWIATLVSGRPPSALAGYFQTLIRYAVHVNAYLFFATGPYPPFLGARGSYVVDVDFPPLERQNRWSIAFRIVLAVPAILLASALGSGVGGGRGWSSDAGVLTVVGILGWFACLARGRMPRGMRDLAIYAIGYGAQTYSYAFLLTDRYPTSDPEAYPAAELPEHPVRLRLRDDDLERNRLLVFFRVLLAIPHLVWLALWAILGLLVAIAAWICALATGRVPDPLHRFLAALVRYSTQVGAFVYLAANPFPGFTGAPGTYPVEAEIGPPEDQSRWTVLFRVFLAVPAFFIAGALGSVQFTAAVLGWWVALFTGRMPRGLRNAVALTLRYSAQTYAYALLLTERYPYSGPRPTARPAPPAPEPAPVVEAV